MITSKIVPVNESREFRADELLYSITNPQGVMQYVNQAFVRISGYEKEDMIGQPHNMVRHPDMPRGVFSLYWEYIQQGKTIAAYVKNLAEDGRYYWVLSVTFPCKSGHLSLRLKPSGNLFEKAQELYAETLEYESKVEKTEGKKVAAKQSKKFLISKLQEIGFNSYDKFMSEALSHDLAQYVKSTTGQNSDSRERLSYGANPEISKLIDLEQTSLQASQKLIEIFDSLEVFHKLSSDLPSKREKMADLGPTLSLLALNTHISASRMGDAGATLSVTSHAIRSLSKDADRLIQSLLEHIETVCTAADSLEFNVAVATIESQISTHLAAELLENEDLDSNNDSVRWFDDILSEISQRSRSVFTDLHDLLKFVRSLANDAKKLSRQVRQIRVAQLNGRIEIASVDCENNYDSIFSEIESVVNEALFECSEILNLLNQTDFSVQEVIKTEPLVNKDLTKLEFLNEELKQTPTKKHNYASC